MASVRVWLVTARDDQGNFIDQRRIEAFSQAQAESDAYDWITSKGGRSDKSDIEELS